MQRLVLVTLLFLALTVVWAQEEPEEEKGTKDQVKTLPFRPPPRPEGDIYIAENFQDVDAVWAKSVPTKPYLSYCLGKQPSILTSVGKRINF